MNERTARERIEQLLAPPDGVLIESPPRLNPEIATGHIIAIIREEVLHPETITAAHKGVPPPVQITRVLTNALNHVFGDPGGNKSDP